MQERGGVGGVVGCGSAARGAALRDAAPERERSTVACEERLWELASRPRSRSRIGWSEGRLIG